MVGSGSGRGWVVVMETRGLRGEGPVRLRGGCKGQ